MVTVEERKETERMRICVRLVISEMAKIHAQTKAQRDVPNKRSSSDLPACSDCTKTESKNCWFATLMLIPDQRDQSLSRQDFGF